MSTTTATHTFAPNPIHQQTLRDRAQIALDDAREADSNASPESVQVSAARALKAWINANPDAAGPMLEPMIKDACYAAVSRINAEYRRAAWIGTAHLREAGFKAHARGHSSASSSLLDFPLPGGRLLRNATKAEVVDAADAYAASGKDALQKATFLRGVAARMKDTGTVGATLKDADLLKIKGDAL